MNQLYKRIQPTFDGGLVSVHVLLIVPVLTRSAGNQFMSQVQTES